MIKPKKGFGYRIAMENYKSRAFYFVVETETAGQSLYESCFAGAEIAPKSEDSPAFYRLSDALGVTLGG